MTLLHQLSRGFEFAIDNSNHPKTDGEDVMEEKVIGANGMLSRHL